MKTKTRQGFRWGSLRFISVWVAGYIVIWVISAVAGLTIADFLNPSDLNFYILFALAALGPTALQGMVQKWVTKRGLRRNLQGWLRISLLGGVVSAVLLGAYHFLYSRYPALFPGNTGMYVFLTAWLFPPAVVQAWWLRKRVKSAWLWAGAALANVLLFSLPLQWQLPSFGGRQYLLMALVALMMGVVSGGVMRYLWSVPQTKPAEKSKQAAQSDALAAPERLALTDAEDAEVARQYAAARKTAGTT